MSEKKEFKMNGPSLYKELKVNRNGYSSMPDGRPKSSAFQYTEKRTLAQFAKMYHLRMRGHPQSHVLHKVPGVLLQLLLLLHEYVLEHGALRQQKVILKHEPDLTVSEGR